MNLTDCLVKENKYKMPNARASRGHGLAGVILKEKAPYQLPKEEKASKDHFTILKAAGAAVVDGVETAGEFVGDAVLGMGVLAKRAVGKKEVMPRLCDDRRAERAAYVLGFLLAVVAVFGAYKGCKSYSAKHQNVQPVQMEMTP